VAHRRLLRCVRVPSADHDGSKRDEFHAGKSSRHFRTIDY
jgi:hypothetical protein